MILELTADDFLDTDVSVGLWEEPHKQNLPQKTYTAEPEVSEEEESLVSSVDTSGPLITTTMEGSAVNMCVVVKATSHQKLW